MKNSKNLVFRYVFIVLLFLSLYSICFSIEEPDKKNTFCHILFPCREIKVNDMFIVNFIIPRKDYSFYRIIDNKDNGTFQKTSSLSDDILKQTYTYDKHGEHTITIIFYNDKQEMTAIDYKSFNIKKQEPNPFLSSINFGQIIFLFIGFVLSLVTFISQQLIQHFKNKRLVKQIYKQIFLYIQEQFKQPGFFKELLDPNKNKLLSDVEKIMNLPKKISKGKIMEIALKVDEWNKLDVRNSQSLKEYFVEEIPKILKKFK